jgi:hypothetical protein
MGCSRRMTSAVGMHSRANIYDADVCWTQTLVFWGGCAFHNFVSDLFKSWEAYVSHGSFLFSPFGILLQYNEPK